MRQYTTKTLNGKLILLTTILASGMAFLDGSVVNIAIPTIQTKLNATITNIQWIINGYALMLCALILISGALGDRFGRKRIFVFGIILFIIASFLCGISHSINQLVTSRFIQGIGGAMMVPGSLSIINISFNESVRGKAIGLWSGFAGGISALGPFAGGWLVQSLGWPSIFYINLPIGLIALFLAIRYVPETRNNDSTKIDTIGAIFIFLALLGISYGFISAPDLGWTNLSVILSILGGVISFLAFILTEKRVKQPLVPFTIFKSSLVTGANAATLLLYFALSGVILFFILNLQQVQHYSPLVAGLSVLPTVLIITFLSGPGGILADKIGPRIPMIIGPIIVSLGMLLLTFPGRNANYILQYLPGLILFGLGMSIVIAPLTKSALSVEEKYSGAASGINNAVARIAGLLAVALLGVVVLSLFKQHVTHDISKASIKRTNQQQILMQQDKLAGIQIPSSFSAHDREASKTIIEDSFIYSFRWAMGINAALAFFSAIISVFTIYNKQKS